MLLFDAAAEPFGQLLGQGVGVALAIDRLEQRVHERPELDHLTVPPANQAGTVSIAAAVDVAEQLDTFPSVEGKVCRSFGLCRSLDRRGRRLGCRGHRRAPARLWSVLLLGDAGVRV